MASDSESGNGSAVALVSGGMDSVVALHELAAAGRAAAALSVSYGSKHNAREIPMAAYHCRKLGVEHVVIDLGFIGTTFASHLLQSGGEVPEGHYEDASMRRTVVPFRNGILLAAAAGLAESRGASAVLIAAHGGDHAIYPDCRESFLAPMAEAIRAGTYAGIRLERPFVGLRKEDIAARGDRLGVDFSMTWSCYKGSRIHCGACGTCVERREAFARAGVDDPTAYAAVPPIPS